MGFEPLKSHAGLNFFPTNDRYAPLQDSKSFFTVKKIFIVVTTHACVKGSQFMDF